MNERWRLIRGDPALLEKHLESMRVIKNDEIPSILEQLKTKSKRQLAKDLGMTRATLNKNLRARNIPRQALPPRYEPNLEPNYHLGYVLGVIYGDGYCFLTKGTSHTIGLGSCDKEFAEYFSVQLCKVLGREKPMPISKQDKPAKDNMIRKPYYHTRLRSKKLGAFLRSVDMMKLEQIINANQDCKTGFLRGFFDSEGCITLSQFSIKNCATRRLSISISNTNKTLLQITKRCLTDLTIKSFNVTEAKMRQNGWNKKPLYILGLSGTKGNIRMFIETIGTRIQRKKRKLREWQYHILPFIRPYIQGTEEINKGMSIWTIL